MTNDINAPKLRTPNFEKMPYSIFFFYIGPKIPGTTWNDIRHYHDQGDDRPIDDVTKLKPKVEALIRNAREPTLTNQFPPPIGAGWRYVVLDRISWVVFAFDFAPTSGPQISVKHSDTVANHCFYDGGTDTWENCKVAFCVNHLKGAPGGVPLGRARQEFVFRLVTVPPVTWEGMPLLPDSGGTNTGPGVPPPG